MPNGCDHSKTKLACIDCSAPICPKCFVECAVGNRCKACAGRFESHLLKVPPAIYVRLVIVSAASGLILMTLSTMRGGYGGFLFQIFIGYLLGRLIHRVSNYKYGPKIAPIAVISCLLGMMLNHNVSLMLVLFLYSPDGASFLFSQCLTGVVLGLAGILIPLLTTIRTK